MKVLLLIAACIAVASSASLSPEHVRIIKNGIAREIMRHVKGFGPNDLIPPIESPLKLNDTHVNFADYPNEYAEGEVSILNGIVEGLNTLTDTLVFNALALTLKGDASIETAAITADVLAKAIIHLPISGETRTLDAAAGAKLSANILKFSITGLSLKIHVNLITDRGYISDLDANLHFDGPIHCEGNGIQWDKQDIDWEAVNADLPGFIADLIENSRPQLLEIVTTIINVVLSTLSISDLIDLIGG